jgi:hypothetical protein
MTPPDGKGDSAEWVWCSPGFSPGADRVAGWLAFRNSIRRFFQVAPDFFILGAQKCGTTALYEVLRQHPELYLSPVKEPRHFIGDGRAPIFQGPGAEDFVRGGVWEPTAYAALFANARVGMRRGEASPVYLSSHRPDETAARIAAAAPRARLIVLLRDPAERAFSAFLHHRCLGFEPLADFGAALAAEDERLARSWLPGWAYRRNGFYAENLRPYLERFPRTQIRVVAHEAWLARPGEVTRDLFAFLGVDADFLPVLGGRHNVSSVRRLDWVARWWGLPSWLDTLNRYRPRLSQAWRERLREEYCEDGRRLKEILGGDFAPSWYD